MADDLFALRNTKLPRHHRDAEDEMRWAADEIERLRKEVQTAFDNGYRAAGGTITPIISLST